MTTQTELSSESSLYKRIKRHVIGRQRTYFIAVTPGFEQLCMEELQSLELLIADAAIEPGGIEFTGELQDCWIANLMLRTANRILMRIASFRARSFIELEKKLADIPWELFLCSVPAFHVTTQKSRLYHSGAIAERFGTRIEKRLKKTAVSSECTQDSVIRQQIFVRVIHDRFTVSVDSSGELLYKRGIKKEVGSAPLRETIAAAALKLAGYTDDEPLIDPMCGAGTFSIEAAMAATRIPPGWFRTFAFMGWPSFKIRRWEHIRREAEKNVIVPTKPFIFASDIDDHACRQLEKTVSAFGISDTIVVSCRDFFEFHPNQVTDRMGTIVLNPPYGLRLGSSKSISELWRHICKRLEHVWQGWKLAIIVPSSDIARRIPFPLKSYPFPHGGQNRILMVGRIA